MIIRGVFSMSIINRLKSLFKGENEETDINTGVPNTSDDVQVTSSKIEYDPIVSGTKTTAPINKAVSETPEDSDKDLTFKKDIKPLEDEVAETSEQESSKPTNNKEHYDGKGKRYFGKNKRRNKSEK